MVSRANGDESFADFVCQGTLVDTMSNLGPAVYPVESSPATTPLNVGILTLCCLNPRVHGRRCCGGGECIRTYSLGSAAD